MKFAVFIVCLVISIGTSQAQFLDIDAKLLKDNDIYSMMVTTDSFDGCPVEFFKFNSKGYRTYYRFGVTESIQKLYYKNGDSLLSVAEGFENDDGTFQLTDSTFYLYDQSGLISSMFVFKAYGDTLAGIVDTNRANIINQSACHRVIKMNPKYKNGKLVSFEMNRLEWPCLIPINEPVIVKYHYDERGLVTYIEFENKKGLHKMTWYCLYNIRF